MEKVRNFQFCFVLYILHVLRIIIHTYMYIHMYIYINKRVCGLIECMLKSLLNYAVPTHVCVK